MACHFLKVEAVARLIVDTSRPKAGKVEGPLEEVDYLERVRVTRELITRSCIRDVLIIAKADKLLRREGRDRVCDID